MNITTNRMILKEGDIFYAVGYRNDNYGKNVWAVLFTKVLAHVTKRMEDSEGHCMHLNPQSAYWEIQFEGKKVEKIVREIETHFHEESPSLVKHTGVFTQVAVKICEVALPAYSGQLLEKALDIAKALVAFEDELKRSQKLDG